MRTHTRRVVAKCGVVLALVLVGSATHTGPAMTQQPPTPPPPQPPATQAAPPAQQQPPQPPAPGRDVAAVARANGRTEDEVRRLFTDPSVQVGANNKIFYVEPPAAPSGPSPAEPAEAAPFPYSDTFLLHSRLGSQRVIYLDFDGHTVSGTDWTGRYGAPASFFAKEYSRDASPSFNTEEQDVVQSVWQRVSEDFAPFDVDVTTQDPGIAAITRNGTADQVYGTRVLITDTTIIAGSCGCGGMAFLDVFDEPFDHALYQPAFVFSSKLGRDAKNIAEASSHEVGHNFDLVHDGTPTMGYYRGHEAWAPIMGVGYDRPITQWSKGEYAGANSLQNDLAVIPTNGGTLLADDHGNSTVGPTVLGAGPTLSAGGVITTDADVDVFRVDAPAGAVVTLSAQPAPLSPNLDIGLELRDLAGTVLAGNDPPSAMVNRDVASGLDASVSATSPLVGGLYLFVSGVGAGDPATTGYSGYGSLGWYSVSGTVQATNDMFASSQPVGGGPPTECPPGMSCGWSWGTTGDDNSGATKEPGEPDHAGNAGGKSVWYRWTAAASSPTTIDTHGSTFDTLLGVYTGSSVDSLTPVAANDNAVGSAQSEVTFPAVQGTVYQIAVDGKDGASGAITLHGEQDTPPTPPTLAVADVTVTEGDGGTTPATFVVTRSGDTSGTATVKYRTATTGTATAGSDYTAVPNTTLTFGPGETTKTATVNVNGDVVAEADEYFYLILVTPTGATLSDDKATGWITNDDTQPTLAVADATVAEGNAGTTPAAFVITRSGGTAGTSTVKARTTAAGTAAAGSDYTALATTTVTFGPGETTKTVTVDVSGDVVAESDEYFNMFLSAPVSATVTDATGVGWITNDDTQPTLAVNDVTVTEGNSGTTPAAFVITRSGGTAGTSTVKYRTGASGTATSGGDYTAVPTTTVTFAPGETTKTVTVNVNGDGLTEGNETYFVLLAAPTGAIIVDNTGAGVITNDDGI